MVERHVTKVKVYVRLQFLKELLISESGHVLFSVYSALIKGPIIKKLHKIISHLAIKIRKKKLNLKRVDATAVKHNFALTAINM